MVSAGHTAKRTAIFTWWSGSTIVRYCSVWWLRIHRLVGGNPCEACLELFILLCFPVVLFVHGCVLGEDDEKGAFHTDEKLREFEQAQLSVVANGDCAVPIVLLAWQDRSLNLLFWRHICSVYTSL